MTPIIDLTGPAQHEPLAGERARLTHAFSAAVATHESRIAETATHQAAVARRQRACDAAFAAMAIKNGEYARAIRAGIQETLAGFDADKTELGQLIAAENVAAEFRALALFSRTCIEDELPLAQESLLEAQVAELLAQADRADALADCRQLELELKLVDIAAVEGDAQLDFGKTQTGLLRTEASRLRLEAAQVKARLEKARESRIKHVDSRVQSLGR